jgi:hypothetical protein
MNEGRVSGLLPVAFSEAGAASLAFVRRGTLITLVVLFVLLAGAAIYQLTIGSGEREPLCGPTTPLAAPGDGECPTPASP